MSCIINFIKNNYTKLFCLKNNRIYPTNEDIFNNELSESIVMQINQANMNEQEYLFENDIPDLNSNDSLNNRVHTCNTCNKSKKKASKKKSKKRKKCPICLEKIGNDKIKCKNKKCGALYHKTCILKWKETKAPNSRTIPCILCTLDTISLSSNNNLSNITNVGYPINRVAQYNRNYSNQYDRQYNYYDDELNNSTRNMPRRISSRRYRYNNNYINSHSSRRPVTVY